MYAPCRYGKWNTCSCRTRSGGMRSSAARGRGSEPPSSSGSHAPAPTITAVAFDPAAVDGSHGEARADPLDGHGLPPLVHDGAVPDGEVEHRAHRGLGVDDARGRVEQHVGVEGHLGPAPLGLARGHQLVLDADALEHPRELGGAAHEAGVDGSGRGHEPRARGALEPVPEHAGVAHQAHVEGVVVGVSEDARGSVRAAEHARRPVALQHRDLVPAARELPRGGRPREPRADDDMVRCAPAPGGSRHASRLRAARSGRPGPAGAVTGAGGEGTAAGGLRRGRGG